MIEKWFPLKTVTKKILSRETIAFPNTCLLSLASSFYNSFKKGESEKTRKRRREEGEKEGGGREGGRKEGRKGVTLRDHNAIYLEMPGRNRFL